MSSRYCTQVECREFSHAFGIVNFDEDVTELVVTGSKAMMAVPLNIPAFSIVLIAINCANYGE